MSSLTVSSGSLYWKSARAPSGYEDDMRFRSKEIRNSKNTQAIDQRAWMRDGATGAGSSGGGNGIPDKGEIQSRCKMTTYKLPLLLATGKVVRS
ncbi:MAG: hypothetical protein K2X55_25860 [Burkholderiaceae bacterium]|nr:hypothetical protein [Burkholderiaceae bacterium]